MSIRESDEKATKRKQAKLKKEIIDVEEEKPTRVARVARETKAPRKTTKAVPKRMK